jgi:hypothetical protein
MDVKNPSAPPHSQSRGDIHPTPDGPRYATRKDFVYGEDVTVGDWTISTDDLPRYQPIGR